MGVDRPVMVSEGAVTHGNVGIDGGRGWSAGPDTDTVCLRMAEECSPIKDYSIRSKIRWIQRNGNSDVINVNGAVFDGGVTIGADKAVYVAAVEDKVSTVLDNVYTTDPRVLVISVD